jgi:hypothetical protein
VLFGKKKENKIGGGGIIIFADVASAVRTEKNLQKRGHEVRLVAPPPELRKGCDLGIEINLNEKPGIERILNEDKADYLEILPVKGSAELLGIVKTTDFGTEIMVKAGNMKLTFDKKSGIILNISGGGCPDIPYLHLQMLDKRLDEAPRPKDRGFTLCSLMLDKAYCEALDIWKRGNAGCF